MRKTLITIIGLISFITSGQVKVLDSVHTDKWTIKDYTSPKMVFETKVYKDSISVKLIKGNGKAMDKLIGTPKFTKVFVGNVEVNDNEFLLKTKEYRITVTRGNKIVYVIVEEKDDFTNEIIKNIYFGERLQ